MSVRFKDVKIAVFILFFSVCCAFLFNALSPKGIALKGQWQVQKGVISAIPKTKVISPSREINHPDLIRQIVENKERAILDVRHKDFYDLGHLPGAMSFPLTQFDEDLKRLQSLFAKDTPILVYCSGFDCDASHIFASRLSKQNYTDVKVFPGGFDQWQKLGLAIENNEE